MDFQGIKFIRIMQISPGVLPSHKCFNHLMHNTLKWSDTLTKSCSKMLEDFESVSDHFGTLCIAGLISKFHLLSEFITYCLWLGAIHLRRPQKMTNFVNPSPTPHLQNWTIDILFTNNRICKHSTNYKTPFCVDIINVWFFK